MDPAMNGIYILVDPFNRKDSGVTTYTEYAIEQLEALGIRTKVIKKNPTETLEEFRVRLRDEVKTTRNILCIEAPESLSATRLVESNAPLHIRLHCSRSLGAVVQGMPFSTDDVKFEQIEIERSKFLSSPSWASYFASKELFKLKKTPNVFPNPAAPITRPHTTEKTYDVTFVGRYQKLKGTAFLEELAKRLPDLSFAVVSPPLETTPAIDNLFFLDGTSMSKEEIYALSSVVIIPSLFETSSMVAIEALTHGCHVVLWQHLGVAEYFSDLAELICVSPGDINKFSEAILRTHTLPKSVSNFNLITPTNLAFRNGLLETIKGGTQVSLTKKPEKHIEKYLKSLVKSQIKIIMKKKQSPFVKKTKKLFLHPIDFFRDSTEAKYIRNKLQERRLKQLASLKVEFKDHPIIADKPAAPVTVIVNSPTVKAIVDNAQPKQKKAILENYITSIGDEGRIEFKVRAAKPKGYGTAFLHHSSVEPELILPILDQLNTYDDFKYVNTERMQLGSFDISEEQTPLSIINRIDAKNKGNLAEINFLIMLNAPANLCYALRYSGTEQRIILIKTEESVVVDHEAVDVLITLFPEDQAGDLSRLIRLESADDIPVAIRRALQEGFPRKKDMLLPVMIGEKANFDRSEFFNFDSRYYQGILKIHPVNHSGSTNMIDIYADLADATVGFALLESVYMRYRSQCELVEQGGSPLNLIKACLKDGVMIDVQEV